MTPCVLLYTCILKWLGMRFYCASIYCASIHASPVTHVFSLVQALRLGVSTHLNSNANFNHKSNLIPEDPNHNCKH